MSRHGYTDSCDDNWAAICWSGQVASAIRGRRGQAFLRELIEALDAMPSKRLIAGALRQDGEVCAMGAVGAKRGVDLESLDVDDYDTIAEKFGIAQQLVREVEYINDADWRWDDFTPEQRWQTVMDWAVSKLKKEPTPPSGERSE